ncbi:vascular endothelial growth factor receptor 1 isoform X2 [Pseudomyrmex gracilis]|uniref:vascular endothelial growth factor receptor 1 isoform X2 n=1 Tax=Pseudomyrmex gracilis TaxID=219809 RepID=UPI000995995D|nr:vascular endothelial growth factor receptor 1 isoform X2 [Pseudomyrmex gracilis]
MLHHAVTARLVLLLVLALFQVSNGKPIIISPNQTEIVINEGSLLEITCISIKPIKFVYPDIIERTSNASVKDEIEENGIFKYVFQRPNTVFSDTGWYGCADSNVEISSSHNHLNDNSEINWLYVYVESPTHFFVEEDMISLTAYVGDDVVLPCRTTSPNLTPILTIQNTDVVKETSFDPKIGVTLKNITVKDSEWYQCKIQKDDIEHELDVILTVHLKRSLPTPIILDESLRHVTRGNDLSVNCSVDNVDSSMIFILDWITPKHLENSSRKSIKDFNERHVNNHLVTKQLTIRNVTDNDAGEYTCSIKSLHETKTTSRNITIHDPEIKYINLTSQHSDNYYEGKERENIQWVVYVDGYPKPTIQWFNPNDEVITESEKRFDVTTTTTVTILKIQSLNINDAGSYILEAKNEYVIKRLNFTLVVMAKPVALLTDIEAYYAPYETAEFQCRIMGFPRPLITWTFLQCPYYPSLNDSQTTELTDVMESTSFKSVITSVAKLPITMSGKITCQACNDLDCDSVTENILVSDGLGAFGIIGPNMVTGGDDVELICAASVYNYTENLSWQDRTEAAIEETERIQIMRHKTNFTYRSTLKINNVTKSDSQLYTCIGQCTSHNLELLSDYATYTLIVNDPKKPYFTATNMNQSKTEINVREEKYKTIILNCFAQGMPKPNITWFKNDKLIKENDQYLFKYNFQELNIKYINESGKYSCRASNRVGYVETYQEIIVKTWQEFDIILSAIIAIMAVIVVILVMLFMIKVRREKMMRKALMETGLMHFEEGALECLNPELTVDDQAELLPYDKKWEFPRERLKLGKQLGSGAFGVVMKAEAQGICEEETVTTVAVKMVRRTTDPTYVRALASELKIMVHLGKHLNVVNLLGACTKNIAKRELLVIVEYCRFGNLHNYLLRHRSNFINQIDPKTGKLDLTVGMDMLTRSASVSSNNSSSANSATDTVVHYSPGTGPDSQEISFSPDGCLLSNNSSQPGWRSNYRGDYKEYNLKPICTQDLLSYAFQVARGMEYLSQRRVLHGDLAARNILLAEDNVVKICDFGLAKTVYKDGNYKKKGDGPLPIKWMAIESIRDRIFSTETDVWSFGIVLWEFFTLAETPYPGMEAEKLYQRLIEGYRMEQPEYALRNVYDIMLQCWKAKPTLRPTFTELVDSIGDLLEESVRSHYITLNTPYMDMNTTNLEGKNDYLTMMSAPTHAALLSPSHDYVNSPFSENAPDSTYLCMSPGCQSLNESGIFSPRPHQDQTRFEFPSPVSDSEDAVEISPMLKHEEDPYLKPINIHERRAEFARQRQTMKNQSVERPIDRDSGYCNTPRNLHLIDLNDAEDKQADETIIDTKKDYTPSIIRTQDNYVNMPKQKSDLRNGMPDAFSNPSYVMMKDNREMDQTV